MDSLLDWCPVPVRPGVGVQSLSQQGERVQAQLSDGTAEEYELSIGSFAALVPAP
jgi:hypothetical protein